MPVNTPSVSELHRIACSYGFDLSDFELEEFRALGASTLRSYARLDQMQAPKLQVKYPRDTGWDPSGGENPYGGWAWRCSIKGAAQGPLSSRTVALKDNICVAAIPMRNGSNVLDGFVPDEDATVVTRILDAGGEIAGKAVCENFCFSGGSHTSDSGPVRNPIDPAFSTGGSSSGSAALVASGAVDMALGGDQGGSIRIPASWCGIVGLKPTHGLVPYTGIFPIEGTLDHTGPMARTVADAALLLEAIAGEDGLDPRQMRVQTARYTEGTRSLSRVLPPTWSGEMP
jgi:amidase